LPLPLAAGFRMMNIHRALQQDLSPAPSILAFGVAPSFSALGGPGCPASGEALTCALCFAWHTSGPVPKHPAFSMHPTSPALAVMVALPLARQRRAWHHTFLAGTLPGSEHPRLWRDSSFSAVSGFSRSAFGRASPRRVAPHDVTGFPHFRHRRFRLHRRFSACPATGVPCEIWHRSFSFGRDTVTMGWPAHTTISRMASALIPFAIGTAASDVMAVFFGPAMPHFCPPDMARAVGRTALLPWSLTGLAVHTQFVPRDFCRGLRPV
jgi:hypothetical protein